jgi:(4S)-4-hydroxy-5-phosphonooxypentane-2,3-dione isomerase
LSVVGEGAGYSEFAEGALLIVHVDIAVIPERVADFLAATTTNGTASLTEPGVVRFDVITDRSDPSHVVLVEVYRNSDAALAHKQTQHYATWRDAVAAMMARPRTSVTFSPVFPAAVSGWVSEHENASGR